MQKRWLAPFFALTVACSSSGTEGQPDTGAPSDGGVDGNDAAQCDVPAKFPSTVDKRFVTAKARLSDEQAKAYGDGPARDPAQRKKLEDEGFGEIKEAPGENHVTQAPPGATPPKSTCPKLLARFAHVPDFQLADDETPTRFAALDLPVSAFRSAARPQEGELCVMLDRAVRSLNELHASTKLDFLLLGGDNIDSSQANEMDWVLGILDGQKGVKCDSGEPNDPVPGAGNDGKDAFDAEGSKVPWYWVNGNHDILVNGNEAVLDCDGARTSSANEAVGADAPDGTRDYSKPGAPVVTGKVPADPKREVLDRKGILKKIVDKTGGAGPAGHGIGAAQAASGFANYTFDVGSKLRFVVWDSSWEYGDDYGICRKSDVEGSGFLKSALDKAKADGKWVFLVSHHGIDTISNKGGLFSLAKCPREAAGIPTEQCQKFFASYPNVVGSIIGHEHSHKVRWRAGDKGGYWEIGTSSLADWPQQYRVFEVFDEGAGWVRVRTTVVDVDWTRGNAAVQRGRKLTALDYACGWSGGGGPGAEPKDRNVDLWFRAE